MCEEEERMRCQNNPGFIAVFHLALLQPPGGLPGYLRNERNSAEIVEGQSLLQNGRLLFFVIFFWTHMRAE